MKKIYAFIAVMLFVFTINGQYIYNDYDANQNVSFSGWPNMPVIIGNPDASGINVSANVAQWDRTNWAQWDNVYAELSGKIDFSTGTTFSLKVYSPITCDVLFKLEDKINGAVYTERLLSVTSTNQWVQLDFDFSGEASDTYDKVVFFIDFATFNENTFYFDDIEGPEFDDGSGGPTATLLLPVTFDVDTAEYDLIDFGGNQSEIIIDPNDPNNNVVKTIKTETAELWAGTTVGGTVGFAEPIPFAAPDTTLMSVVVWSPAVGIPIRLKVEDANNPGITCETEALSTVASAWDTLVFDFSNPAPGTPAINFANTYNKASIFFNFGTTGGDAGEQTYYWDYMDFIGAPEPKPLLELNVQDNFEDDGWGTVDEWIFQDPGFDPLPVVPDPEDGSNTVADYNRSGTFEWTNAQFVLDHRMDLSERNKFELDVFLPSSNDYSGALNPAAAIKLQNSKLGGNAWQTQTEIVITVEDFDQWVTLLFDFSAVADSVNYDQVIIQLGGEGHWVPGQFYFDNLYLKHVPYVTIETPNGGEVIEQGSNFDINWNYNYWEGDIDIELLKEGGEPEQIVIGLSASDTTYSWNVIDDQEPGEDYRIIITSVNNSFPTDTSDAYFTILEVGIVLAANFSADTTLVTEGDSVVFSDLSSGGPDNWEWYFEGGTPETFDGQNPPEILYETEGAYDVSLTVYGDNDQNTLLMEDYIEVIKAVVILTPPDSLQANVGPDDDVQLSWNAPGDTVSSRQLTNVLGYNVYRDDVKINSELILVTEYNDPLPPIGSHDYYVTAVYDEGESEPSNVVSVVVTDIFEKSNISIMIYPNPTDGIFTLKLPPGETVDFDAFDITGKKVYSNVMTSTTRINISDWKKGIYFLQIQNNSSKQTVFKKLILR